MLAEIKQNEPLAEEARVSLHSCLCHCSLKEGTKLIDAKLSLSW